MYQYLSHVPGPFTGGAPGARPTRAAKRCGG
jgi:hypothetical protein